MAGDRGCEVDLRGLTFAAWRKERQLQTNMLRERFVAADANADGVLQLTEFWQCINAFTDGLSADAGVARGRAEELFNETCAESERLAGETLADDAITEDAFVAVMLRRGLRDGEYEPHFERHPEQRQVSL